jgi:hypothetical protein
MQRVPVQQAAKYEPSKHTALERQHVGFLSVRCHPLVAVQMTHQDSVEGLVGANIFQAGCFPVRCVSLPNPPGIPILEFRSQGLELTDFQRGKKEMSCVIV